MILSKFGTVAIHVVFVGKDALPQDNSKRQASHARTFILITFRLFQWASTLYVVEISVTSPIHIIVGETMPFRNVRFKCWILPTDKHQGRHFVN